MNKAQKVTTSVILALLVFAVWASAGLSKDRDSRGSTPADNVGAREGTTPSGDVQVGRKGMRAEEKLVRDVYARLMRYHTAAMDERDAREGKASKPDEYLTFELEDIHTGLIADIAGRSPGKLITGTSGELIKIRPFHLSNGDGPAHAYYEAEWSTEMETHSSETAKGSDYATLEEMLHSSGDKFAGSDRYVSYQVTVRLNGKQRTYRALVLSRHDDAAVAEIFDNITSEMNAVLRDESPRVRSPWSKYVKSSLYLAVAREIREKIAAGQPLIPAEAPIGYLPGDNAEPNAEDKQILAANVVCQQLTVSITAVNIDTDNIATTLSPTDASGTFTLRWVGANTSFTLVQQNRNGGTHSDSFQIANLPNGATYTSLQATWLVNGQTGSASQDYKLTVLGDYINTCYNTPTEGDFPGTTVNAGTATSACVWSSRNFSASFLDAVNLNGSGVDSSNTAIQIEGFCNNPPGSSPPYNGRRYRRPTDIRTSCQNAPTVDWTVASSSLACGTPVYINTIGRRLVQDTGGGLAADQIDNYKGVGRQTCQGWSNNRRKTVQLY